MAARLLLGGAIALALLGAVAALLLEGHPRYRMGLGAGFISVQLLVLRRLWGRFPRAALVAAVLTCLGSLIVWGRWGWHLLEYDPAMGSLPLLAAMLSGALGVALLHLCIRECRTQRRTSSTVQRSSGSSATAELH
jgi:signal transduction histidine kinase